MSDPECNVMCVCVCVCVCVCARVLLTLTAVMKPVTISKRALITNKLMKQPAQNKHPVIQNTVCTVQQWTNQHRPALHHVLTFSFCPATV